MDDLGEERSWLQPPSSNHRRDRGGPDAMDKQPRFDLLPLQRRLSLLNSGSSNSTRDAGRAPSSGKHPHPHPHARFNLRRLADGASLLHAWRNLNKQHQVISMDGIHKRPRWRLGARRRRRRLQPLRLRWLHLLPLAPSLVPLCRRRMTETLLLLIHTYGWRVRRSNHA